MSQTEMLIIVSCAFFAAAFVKGLVGFGLPPVSIGLLTAFIGLPNAMALIIFPGIATNLWQGLSGNHFREIIRRFWPFFLMTVLFTFPGTLVLSRLNVNYVTALLGVLLLAFVAVTFLNPKFRVKPRSEPILNPVLGTISGLLSGMTGTFTVPGVIYFQSVGLPREQLVQLMGIMFTLSTVALALALGGNRLLTVELAVMSAIAVIPTFVGLAAGTWLRRRTSEQGFRVIFLMALGVLGVYILGRSLAVIL